MRKTSEGKGFRSPGRPAGKRSAGLLQTPRQLPAPRWLQKQGEDPLGAIGRDFVFVHLPKTAGTSLTDALCSRGATATAHCTEILAFCLPRTTVKGPAHLRARDLLQYFGEAEWRRRFTFGIARNPWDRLVSTYNFVRNRPTHEQHARISAQSFEQFVRERAEAAATPEGMATALWRGPHLWFDDADGRQLVDAVYRLEDLTEAYPEILRRCGIAEHTPLPHINNYPHDHYRAYYSEDLAARVADLCADEISRFAYSY